MNKLFLGADADTVSVLNLELIKPNAEQPRKVFADEPLNALAQSIKENGLIQPIVVSPKGDDGKYQIIAGERRYRAYILNEEQTIPAIIKKDANTFSLAIVENLQRENLHPIEEADSIAEYIAVQGVTQQEASQTLAMHKSRMSEMLNVAKLPDEIKAEALGLKKVSKAILIALAGVKNKKQQAELWGLYKQGKINLKDIQNAKKPATTASKPKEKPNTEAQRQAFIKSSSVFAKTLTEENKNLLTDEGREKLVELRDALDSFLAEK